MKIVILGASGFIGSHIYSHFNTSGIECVRLSGNDLDLTDRETTLNSLPAVVDDAHVVVAAGIPRLKGDDHRAFLDNIRMIQNVSNCLESTRVRSVVFLSTVEVYGKVSGTITENTPLSPLGPYAISKYTGEMLLENLHARTGVPVVILRLPGVYGSGDRGLGFIGTLANSIRKKETFTLVGDGSELRDYLYVGDLPRVIERLITLDKGCSVFNVASSRSHRLNEIIDLSISRLGALDLRMIPREGEPMHLVFDNTKIMSHMPDFMFTEIDAGIENYRQKRDGEPAGCKDN